jgi:hypothetical protein
MAATSFLLALFLGIGLAASTGLNTSLPLLLFGIAARFHIAGIALNPKFAWLHSDVALIVLVIAAIFEIVADKFPAVDHALDTIGTVLRPLAGALAAAAALTHLDPLTAAIVGLIVGAPISFGLHTIKAGTRLTSSVATFGCANPILSLIEDVASATMTIIAIFIPIIVPLVVAVVAILLWRVARKLSSSQLAARSSQQNP